MGDTKKSKLQLLALTPSTRPEIPCTQCSMQTILQGLMDKSPEPRSHTLYQPRRKYSTTCESNCHKHSLRSVSIFGDGDNLANQWNAASNVSVKFESWIARQIKILWRQYVILGLSLWFCDFVLRTLEGLTNQNRFLLKEGDNKVPVAGSYWLTGLIVTNQVVWGGANKR